MDNLIVKIATPDGEIFSGEAKSILVKTDMGDVQIMKDHTDYMAALGTGRAKIVLPDGTERSASAAGGFIMVANGEARVVATTFEFSETIDIARANRAKAEAEERLKNEKDENEIKILKAKLARAISRINIATKKY